MKTWRGDNHKSIFIHNINIYLIPIFAGLISVYILEQVIVGTVLPPLLIGIGTLLHMPISPPGFDELNGAMSFNAWVAYVVSGIIVAKIAKKYNVALALITGLVAAIFYIVLQFPLNSSFEVFYYFRLVLIVPILFAFGGIIGDKLHK